MKKSRLTDSQLLAHTNFYLDTNNYYNYFDCLWSQEQASITSVGDVTPAYAMLPIEASEKIKAGLEARGFNVKVVFLMRDPIERCWSALRMGRRNRINSDPSLVLADEQDAMGRAYKANAFELRTRYELTINNLESVFKSKKYFYGFYETLFDKRTLNDIKSFLNLDNFEPDVTQKINVSEKTTFKIKDELAKEIFDFYKETYEFCDQKFNI